MQKKIIALIGLLLLTVLSAFAHQQPDAADFPFKPGQSVYVIAVKSRAPRDRTVWQNLSRNMPKTRQAGTLPSSANDKRATIERGNADRLTLDRQPEHRILPPEEPNLKKRIEDEFLKQKSFKLAESPETADLVFFAHGEYFHYESMRQESAVALIGMIGPGDDNLELNAIAKLTVACVTASDYRQWQSDIPQLLEKAKWQVEAWGEFHIGAHYEEPSVKKLIQQFHKQTLKK